MVEVRLCGLIFQGDVIQVVVCQQLLMHIDKLHNFFSSGITKSYVREGLILLRKIHKKN